MRNLPFSFLSVLNFLILFIPTINIAFASQANKSPLPNVTAYFFGGGGERPQKVETDFLYDAQTLKDVGDEKKWSKSFFHDGGHAADNNWMNSLSTDEKASFTSKIFSDKILEMENKVKTKQVRQLMIYISTHGKEKNGLMHSVQTIDGAANMKDLKDLIALAEKKEIPLAIIDTSCFGGASINLGTNKKYTCVISMSDDDLAYGTDSNSFLRALKVEPNLEAAFLKSRLSANSRGNSPVAQPQISTDIGSQIRKELEFFKEDLHDITHSKSNCPEKTLGNKNISDFESLLEGMRKKRIALDPAVNDYLDKLRSFRLEKVKVMTSIENTKKMDKKICLKKGDEDCLTYSELESKLQNQQNMLNEIKDKKNFDDMYKTIVKETVHELTILKSRPEYLNYQKMVSLTETSAKNLHIKAANISRIERDLYNKLYINYSQTQKHSKNESNPCRNFKIQ